MNKSFIEFQEDQKCQKILLNLFLYMFLTKINWFDNLIYKINQNTVWQVWIGFPAPLP
jgi:hypothetical protein